MSAAAFRRVATPIVSVSLLLLAGLDFKAGRVLAEQALSYVEPPSAVVVTPLLPAEEGGGLETQAVALDSPLGQPVQTAHGESAGRVVDVLADSAGRVRAAVIEFGGFLGVGSKKVAIAWNAIRFNPGAKPSVIVDATRDQLRIAPAYKSTEPPKSNY